MKKSIYIIIAILTNMAMHVFAQPAAVKNAAKSVFTLNTFRADGSLLANSHGVFVGQNGEAISDLKPFIGASSAVVIDQKGTKMDVSRLLGIDEAYDVIHFRVDGKTTPAKLAIPQSQGTTSWLISYALKNPEIHQTTIKSVESFGNQYAYYIFNTNAPDNTEACPYVNAAGEVMGLMKVSTTSYDTHAVDARYAQSLTLSALSYNDPTIRQIAIPLALPTEQQQAQLALVMAHQCGDSLKYVSAIDDFIKQFPTLTDGYDALARQQLAAGQIENADNTMNVALKKAENNDEVHYLYSRLIYDKVLYKGHIEFGKWTLSKALDEIDLALNINPMPTYLHHKAQVLYAQDQYQQALDLFKQLYDNKEFSNPELLFEQAQCKTMLNAPTNEIIALLDSAILTTDTLRFSEAAPYFLARANIYMEADSFRQAVFDYTRYEILVQGRVSADFYYIRSQAEVKGKLYQQALADMGRAIRLNPNEPTYFAEMAQQLLRVGQVDEAVQFAERSTEIAPDYPEGWLLLGLSLVRKNQKQDAINAFQKAKELGSEQADTLMEKYK